MSGNHAIVAPSSLALTVACNGWIQLAQNMPQGLRELVDGDDDSTREGNAADWVAKQYANGNEVPYGSPIPLPGNYKVDHTMIRGAQMWCDVIGYGSISGVPVICERIHPTDCWGEPDGWRWDAIAGILRLPDYKYGFDTVEVFENWQLIAYAAGIMKTLGLHDSDVTIEFTIVQPRAFHKDGPVRRWTVNGADIRALVNRAWNAAVRAWPVASVGVPLQPPETHAGPHCLYCPARVVCHTFQQAVAHAIAFAFSGRATRVTMNDTDVGVQLALVQDAMEMLKAANTGLEAQADSLLRAGKRVPNFIMEPGQSHLKWNEGVTVDDILTLGAVMQKNFRKPDAPPNSRNSVVVTPTQAKDALGKVDAAVIDAYASRPNAPMKLTRESTTAARRAFGDTP